MSGHYALYNATVRPRDDCVFQRNPPTATIFAVYGLAVPMLATLGLCTNLINAVVFMRPKMTPSAFSYLAALSFLDCVSCLLITLTALSRSYFSGSIVWITYDYQWQSPLFGISTGAANLTLACMSLDRFIYLTRFQTCNRAPRFCRRKVARCMIVVVIIISIVANIPYFFVFVVNQADGTCQVTNFYYSKYYKMHNWFSFALLALLPAIFLVIGNAAIIIAFRRWTTKSKLMCGNTRATQKRYHHQVKLTISIVIVITLYLVGELPAHMTSRKSALNLLFGGDKNKVNMAVMERLEVVCLTLNALQLTLNIMVYAVINPSFLPEFFLCYRGASDFCLRLCCLTDLRRSWRKCCSCRKPSQNETCVAGNMLPPQLPAVEAPPNDLQSWSTDSEFEQRAANELEQPDVFATRSSVNLHCTKSDNLETDSVFNANFFIISYLENAPKKINILD